jgi:hypothetical protein
MRFTQEGMLVKSMLVPLVEATAVPLVIILLDIPEITGVLIVGVLIVAPLSVLLLNV